MIKTVSSLLLAWLAASSLWAQSSSPAWPVGEWRSLFNGKDLSGWQATGFAGGGEVEVKNGEIVLGAGVALTGIHRTNDLLRTNYEILLRSKKIDGNDFFSAMTFPVKDSHCTFVTGGWGGALVGISSLDGMDASENETTAFYKFEKGKEYEFKVRVTDRRIQGWIDGDKVVDAVIADRRISMRAGEIELSMPFGIASFQSIGAIKEIKIRPIPAGIKKISFLAGKKSHGPGEHDYEKGLRRLKDEIENRTGLIAVDTSLHLEGWPVDEEDIADSDTIVAYCDGSDHDLLRHPLIKHDRWKALDRLMKRGVGLVCLHYTVFAPNDPVGPRILDWLGGYFDYQSGNTPNKWFSKIETREFETFLATPAHPIAQGVRPFKIKEEYYFNMKFPEDKSRVTPILTFDPEKKDWSKVVGWATERADGGRGFGYTGGHFHANWDNDDVRRLIVNAILWTAKTAPGTVAAR